MQAFATQARPAAVEATKTLDPWKQQRALVWTDVTTAEQARKVLYGRCDTTVRPWVLPTEPISFRAANGVDIVDDETFWICQRLLGLGSFVERVQNWSHTSQLPLRRERVGA